MHYSSVEVATPILATTKRAYMVEGHAEQELCRACVGATDRASELLDNDLMITRREQRLRRIGFGSLAAAGLCATLAAPASVDVGGVFTTSALLAEAAVGSNF